MTSPRWPADQPGGQAMFKGEKGDKGERGGMTRGAFRAFLTVVILIFGISVAGFFISARAISKLTVLAQSQCESNAHLGTIPLPVTLPAGQPPPAKATIRFIIDQREAWRRADCPGKLGRPSPGLVHWAKVYNLPVH